MITLKTNKNQWTVTIDCTEERAFTNAWDAFEFAYSKYVQKIRKD